MSELYEMKLHDEFRIGEDTRIMRVPGGWIYTIDMPTSAADHRINSVFVPYNVEFEWGG